MQVCAFRFLANYSIAFDENGADDRHPVVAIIDDALHMLHQELPLVVKRRAVLEGFDDSPHSADFVM
jgi:hypothetical protein